MTDSKRQSQDPAYVVTRMTRKPNVRSSILAARSSFWETSPQECGVRPPVRASISEPDPTTSSLYDQLLQLKDWTEEKAELCSVSPDRERMSSLATTTLNLPLADLQTASLAQVTETCSREDSAMRLSHGDRLSRSSGLPSDRPTFHQGTVSRVSSGSVKSARSSNSRRRSFCRSSFSATRTYESRNRKQRQRTFVMAELEPAKNSNSNVTMLEVQDMESDHVESMEAPSKCSKLLGMAASSWGAADQMMRSVVRGALYHEKSITQRGSKC